MFKPRCYAFPKLANTTCTHAICFNSISNPQTLKHVPLVIYFVTVSMLTAYFLWVQYTVGSPFVCYSAHISNLD